MIILVLASFHLKIFVLKENDEFAPNPPPPLPHIAIIVWLCDNLHPSPFENDSIAKEEVKAFICLP